MKNILSLEEINQFKADGKIVLRNRRQYVPSTKNDLVEVIN